MIITAEVANYGERCFFKKKHRVIYPQLLFKRKKNRDAKRK